MPYRPTQRTEARKAATRERIVAAALDQVAAGGYASASVQAVAGRAGLAVGTLYRHFPSKAELFAEVFRRASQRELDVLIEVSSGDGSTAERVARAAEAFSRRALAGPVLAYALLAEPVDPAVESERLRLRRGYRDAFARVLEEGVAAGELRPHAVQTLGAVLVGGLGEALVGPLSAHDGRRSRNEALVASLVQFCLNALPTAEVQEAIA
ncbi:MAG: TetR/AcrR family transcriptional regulator [Thermoleophilaceae bacterium]